MASAAARSAVELTHRMRELEQELRETTAARDLAVARAVNTGTRQRELVELTGLTRGRISQILRSVLSA